MHKIQFATATALFFACAAFAAPDWAGKAIVYEIYPQSFYDTNGDGIGDLPGVIEKLDYVKDLGANTIWLNPCFLSPFQDAGYDIEDYRQVAPRYGTNADLERLFREAHRRGIRVLLDLVPAHTSIRHPWFLDSSRRGKASPYDQFYIWEPDWLADTGAWRFSSGMAERDGYFMVNFFHIQPKLNFGFCPPDPKYKWQKPIDDPACLAVRAAIKDVMKFWLDKGCDGFRVDSACTLVFGPDADRGNVALWQDFRAWLDKHYPQALMVSEWSDPPVAVAQAGFHADFMAHTHHPGYNMLLRCEPDRIGNGLVGAPHSFFDRSGLGDASQFFRDLVTDLDAIRGKGYVGLITGNHDIGRVRGGRSLEELKGVYAFLFLLPGMPFVYNGDEIGMNNVFGLGNKEGSYNRSAVRTPMQWTSGPKAGFSSADPAKFYLPLDPSFDRPDVASQEKDPASLLNFTRALLNLRAADPAVANEGSLEILYLHPFTTPVVYARTSPASRTVVAVNPSDRAVAATFGLEDAAAYIPFKADGVVFASVGVKLVPGAGATRLEMPPRSYAIFRRAGSK